MGALETINGIIWGIPTVTLILAVGAYLSIRTGFAQLRLLPDSARRLHQQLRKGEDGTSFRALCTALAATVGTGNVAGVAGAIALGGPGSIFWIWICALLGMMTKFAEALLAVKFRIRKPDGSYAGGVMYMIDSGLGRKWHTLAICYSFLGMMAAFGVGNAAQVNAAVSSAESAVAFLGGQGHMPNVILIGGALAFLAAIVPLGGAGRVGSVAELLVPVAAAAYTALCVGALLVHWRSIPGAFQSILQGAFQPRAVTGGAVGGCMTVLRVGTARGVFTNEAGMGTAAIAHGTANVSHPAQQGLMGIMEVFLDTIVICTMTALVILTSAVEIPYGIDEGAVLTIRAFACTYGEWVCIPMAAFLTIFAAATILGWGFYGLQYITYLLGDTGRIPFSVLQAAAALLGALKGTGDIWILSELLNGLMAIPNLIVLILLRRTVIQLTAEFIQGEHRMPASGKSLPEGRRWRHAHSHGRGFRESFRR